MKHIAYRYCLSELNIGVVVVVVVVVVVDLCGDGGGQS